MTKPTRLQQRALASKVARTQAAVIHIAAHTITAPEREAGKGQAHFPSAGAKNSHTANHALVEIRQRQRGHDVNGHQGRSRTAVKTQHTRTENSSTFAQPYPNEPPLP